MGGNDAGGEAGMVIEWDLPIEVDDGLVLRADVFRPAAEGRYPAILTHGPYAKGLHFADGYTDQWNTLRSAHPDVEAGSSNRYQSWELPDPDKWVPHGYALVRVDSRGAGSSPGFLDVWSERETSDFFQCIEWAAAQSWCSGKVGLSGISYYAINQWQVAALRPPHLAAICPWEGAADWYRDAARHGGILCSFSGDWYGHQVAVVQHGVGELGGRNRETGKLIAGDETLSPDELERNRADFGRDIAEHLLIDDYYSSGRIPDLTHIDVPMLSAGNWGGHGLHLRGNVEGFVRSSSEHKWLELHGLEHWTHYYTDYGRTLQKEFFDHFLKDIDNGWDQRPPVILNVRHHDGSFTLRAEEDWPIPRTRWTKLYLDASERRLALAQPEQESQVSYAGKGEGVTFSWTLDEAIELTGPLAAKLFVSSETVDADIFVILRAFDPAGEELTFQGALEPHSPLAHGWLRASHRELDDAISVPERPYHKHDQIRPLEPGQAYELDIEVLPTCITLPAGYTLALSVQGVDYQYSSTIERFGWFEMTGVGPFKHESELDRPDAVFGGSVTLHTGGERVSYLLAPVIPAI
jgi:uncharacterized protein